MIRKHYILPISVNQQRLTLGMVDPLNYEAIDDVRILTGLDVLPVLVSENDMNAAIQQFAALQVDSRMEKLLGELNQQSFGVVEMDTAPDIEDDAPVIRMVNSILQQAVQVTASDIHIEPLGMMCGSDSVLTENWWKCSPFPRNHLPPLFPGSRSWATWISPKNAFLRMGGPG